MGYPQQDNHDPWKNAMHVQDDAAALGFDWPNTQGVLDKLQEELQELRDAVDANDMQHAREELGDLLLAATNLARFLNADPTQELIKATQKFEKRFRALKKHLKIAQHDIQSCTLEELEALWQKVKTHERQ